MHCGSAPLAATSASSRGRATRLDSCGAGSADFATARFFGAGRCATCGTGFLVLLDVLTACVAGADPSTTAETLFAGRSAKRTTGRAGCSRASHASPTEPADTAASPSCGTGARSCATATDHGQTVVAASKANTREMCRRVVVMAPMIGRVSFLARRSRQDRHSPSAPLSRKSSPKIACMSATADGATVKRRAPREFCYIARSSKDKPARRPSARGAARNHESTCARTG